jgi:sodium-dependent dicarboxylate transporter 2/3/5
VSTDDAGVSRAWLALAVLATAAVIAAPTPAGLTPRAQAALATGTFAAVLWVSGGLPLWLTGLLVPVLLTALGVYPGMAESLTGFADPVLALFLGTFALAGALQAHGLDRRLALAVVARTGGSARRLVAGLAVAAAVLSMLISNTATAALLVPVTVGLVDGVEAEVGPDPNLRVAALLAVAYGASVGGVGTLVGTPPNAIAVAQLDAIGVRVTFLDWVVVGLPTAALTLPIVWAVLVRLHPPATNDVRAAAARARELSREAGSLDAGARRVAIVFAFVAGLWLLGGVGALVADRLPPAVATTLFGGPGPSVVGPGAHQGLLYFALVGLLAVPALALVGEFDGDDLAAIDWPTLFLFGGGLSLADALGDTGATGWIADGAFGALAGVPLPAVVLGVALLTVALSELASNTATIAVLAPVLADAGASYGGGGGVLLVMAGGLAASYGFALPVATPPNAVAYGTGAVTRRDLLHAGLLLDVLLAVVVSGLLVAYASLGLLPG